MPQPEQDTSATIKLGRLNEQDIEKLVKEAEQFRAEDEAIKKRIEAKNQLEHYCYTVKNQMNEEKLKDKFTDDDKKVIEDKSKEILQWMEGNPNAEFQEYEAKQKEMDAVFHPIMTRIYKETGGPPGGAGGMPGMPPGGMPGMPGGMPGMPGGMGGMPGMGGMGGMGGGAESKPTNVDDVD